jgi:hypothetical protein
MTVSASFLVKDPPLDRLAALVAFLRPVVSEFAFAIDDRTKPETVEIIRQWEGAVTVPFRWCDDFSAGRNASLALCTSDWTLIVDPDEIPSVAMLDFVAMVDRSPWEDVTWQGSRYPAPRGYLFFTQNWEDGAQGPEWEEHWHCRLFRTSEATWYRPVHELVNLGGMAESSIRGTSILPKAPRSAYLIHSKLSDVAPASTELYVAIGGKA